MVDDVPLSANTGVAQLVVASGLRNPFRMEIDELTGNLYVGDVGEALSEELNEYVRGAGNPVLRDFGWSRREGLQPGPGCPTDPTTAPVDPIFAEFNAAGWKSIMAGPCYRNRPQVSGFGPSYEGNVFVTDYYSGEIRRLVKSGAAWQVATPVAGPPATPSPARSSCARSTRSGTRSSTPRSPSACKAAPRCRRRCRC